MTTPRGSLAVAVLLAALVLPSGAGARDSLVDHSFRPQSLRAGVATFRLSRLKGSKVVSARLTAPGAGRAVSARFVRRAVRSGTLRLRVARSWRARSRIRLVVRTKGPGSSPTAVSAKRKLSPAPDPAPAPAPDPAPAPAPDPTAPCGPAVGGFGGLVRPPACWRPYSPTSPFNTALPATPAIDSRSAAIVQRLLGFGPIEDLVAGKATSSNNDYGRPAYFSTATDPWFTVHCTEAWGTCAVEGAVIRIPDAATAASGTDGHLSVVDQASGMEYDFWRVQSKPLGGGTLTVAWGGRTPIDGDGRGSDAVAARYGSMAGVLRLEELQAGRIDHALFMNVHCDSGSFVYPATKTGQACSKVGESNTDAPAMGTRFQLNMSDAEIDALSVPVWKKAILRAMARYGLIAGDTGSVWGIKEESARVYTSFGLSDQWAGWASTQAGVTAWEGKYYFGLKSGVDWQQRLRVIAPCVSQRTC